MEAFIHPNAKVDSSVQIGPYVVIEDDVVIGPNCILDAHAVICSGVRMGRGNHVFPGAVIGAIPQDLKFKGEQTTVEIGDYNTFRECVTVHRGTASKGKTVIGSNNLIMAYCHIAHDCVLHNNIIMSNATQVAGEVEIDDCAVIGGGTLIHQFSHIGSYVMLQGGVKVNKDVPPCVIAAREPISFCGLNSVGLKRRGFDADRVARIQEVYRYLFMSNMNITQAIEYIEANVPDSPEKEMIVSFVKSSPRGVIKGL